MIAQIMLLTMPAWLPGLIVLGLRVLNRIDRKREPKR